MKNQVLDPVFGLLEIDPSYRWAYQGKINFLPKESVAVYLLFDDLQGAACEISDEDAARALNEAQEVYAAFKEQEPIVRRSVAAWAYEGDWTPPTGKTREAFTLEEFISCMTLRNIHFHGAQIFSVVYDFADLFDGFLCDYTLNEDFTLYGR